MKDEYRVVWLRKGWARKKVKIYAKRNTAERFIEILTSSEPWKSFGLNPDDVKCCDGYQCNCRGETVKEFHDRLNADLPEVESCKLQIRQASEWTNDKSWAG